MNAPVESWLVPSKARSFDNQEIINISLAG